MKEGEGIYIVPILIKLEEVPCSCKCGHSIALVLNRSGVQYMIGCKECVTQSILNDVIKENLTKWICESKKL